MKIGPVTKRDNRNIATSQKFENDVMLTNCDLAVFFLIYGQFVDIRKLDSGRMLYIIYIFIKNNLLSSKT